MNTRTPEREKKDEKALGSASRIEAPRAKPQPLSPESARNDRSGSKRNGDVHGLEQIR